jgi:hypothetical protein
LVANGVDEADTADVIDGMWPSLIDPATSLPYADWEAVSLQLYGLGVEPNGILKQDIIDEIPSGPVVNPDLPPQTEMVGYYNGDSVTDYKSGYDLVEDPAGDPYDYSSGTFIGSSTKRWTQGDIDDVFAATDQDWSLIFVFKATGTPSNGSYPLTMSGGKTNVRWLTSGMQMRIADVNVISGVVPSVGTDYAVYLQFDSSEAKSTVVVNSIAPVVSAAGTFAHSSGQLSLNGNSQPFTTNYFGFFDRLLTQTEYEQYTENPTTGWNYSNHPVT